ncbi:DUF736 domain-containing protein [Roseobacter sp. MH60115]|uniref:DUF736 domain-containing protein n=1 Tax=Roseobacter sp. MH60115 TaxID=2785324 RepID=UPI003FA364AF
MATIGTFKKTGSEYVGEIVTLSVQAKAVRIVAEDSLPNENAPSHRVFVGRAEIGAAWPKRSAEGRDYLSLKPEDRSFTQPIYANLFDDTFIEGGEETFSLIWSHLTLAATATAPHYSSGKLNLLGINEVAAISPRGLPQILRRCPVNRIAPRCVFQRPKRPVVPKRRSSGMRRGFQRLGQ